MSSIPPPPPGFVLDAAPAAPPAAPTPPPGFVLDTPPSVAFGRPVGVSDDALAGAGDAAKAYSSGVISGLPVVGPTVKSWIDDIIAHVNTAGHTVDERRRMLDEEQARLNQEHPTAKWLGETTGGLAGYGAAAMAAPELFGGGTAPLLRRTIASGATNSLIGAADSAARGGSPKDILTGAGMGVGLGALVPGVGKVVGAIARPIARPFSNWFAPAVSGMRRSAANALADALTRDAAVMNVPARLRELGPEAVLPDASPSAKGWAQGLNTKYPAIENTLVARDKGAPTRILSDLDQHLGPAGNSPLAEQKLTQAQMRLEGQALPSIFRTAPPVDVSQALATIGQKLQTAVGPEAKALATARSYLMEGRPGNLSPVKDAQKIHNAKDAIDNLINYGNDKLGIPAGAINKEQGALKLIRGQVNQALRDQVGGYGDVMDKISELRKQAAQLKAGTEILRTGEAGVHPQDLTTEMAGLSPEAQAAKRFGARAAIDRAVRQSPNDRLALKQVLGGEGDFKRTNAEILFGQQPTAKIANTADREATFFDTKHRVVDNSETQRRLAAEKMVNPVIDKPGAAHTGILAATFDGGAGLATYAGLRAGQKAIQGLRGALLQGRNSDIARALVSRDAPTLAQALIDRGMVRATAGESASQKASALARALVGYEGSIRKGEDFPSLSTVKRVAIGTGATLYNMLPAAP